MVRKVHIGLLLLIFMGLPVCAQDDSQSFGDVIDVQVINLEVVVTGRDGEFVPGLEPRDFRLLVDGEEVSIEYFSEVRGGRARPSVRAPEKDADTGIQAIPSVSPGEIVGTSFLLFIDNFFGHGRDRRIVLEKLIDEVHSLGPEDRMAIVAFDGEKLELVSTWTSSSRTLTSALRKAMTQPASGIKRRSEFSSFALQHRSLSTGLIKESDLHLITQYVDLLSLQVQKVLAAATTAMRSFAMPPGRKVMLLTSGGWPRDPSTFVAGMNAEIRNRTWKTSPVEALNDLASTANLLGYTIYPIDLPGRMVNSPGADDALGLDPDPASPVSGGDVDLPDPIPVNTLGKEHDMELSLLALAEKTGGQAMINGWRETAMVRVLEDTGSYYWIGFAPRLRRNDEEHEVEIEVLRDGLKTRSREGFKDLSRQTEVTMMVESHLLFSTHLGGRSLKVKLGEVKKKRRGRIELPVSLTIPLDEITMLPEQDAFKALLELRVIALDESNHRSEVPVIPIAFSGPAPQPGAYAFYDTVIQLRSSTRRLVLALYDLVGEKILTTIIELDPEST